MERLLLISNSTQHGGGYLEHCRAEIAKHVGEGARVLFVPFALKDHDQYAAKARAAFEELGCSLRSAHESDQPVRLLDEADAVFIGGGNTFRLLTSLYETGLLEAVRDRAAQGMPYIGTSAGSNVACRSVRTTNDMPIMYPPTFDAMGLVPFNINPHYIDPDPASEHMGETRETRIREFHEDNTPPVVGLREGCMLKRHGDELTLLGTTAARLFERGEVPVEYQPGADHGFLLDDDR